MCRYLLAIEWDNIHLNMYVYLSVAKLPVAYHSKLLGICLLTKNRTLPGPCRSQ